MRKVMTFIVSLIMSFLSIFFPAETPFETETVKIDGVTYQNGVVPENMYLKKEYDLYEEEPIHIERTWSLLGGSENRFYSLEKDYVYRNENTSKNADTQSALYCLVDKWEEKHSYYADEKNYSYRFQIWEGNDNVSSFHTVKKADINKFNEILDFDMENGFLTAAYPTVELIKLPSKAVPSIRFCKESKDGLIETHTSSFIIYDGTLYLYRYLNGTTMEIEVAVVPDELRAYFTDVLKNGGYGEYFK